LFIIVLKLIELKMSQKKNYLYRVGRQSVAEYFFLLGHCERMEILETLRRFGPTSFGALLLNSPLSKSTLTQHLQMLRRLGMITPCEVHKGSGYTLNEEAIHYARKLMFAYLEKLDPNAEPAIAA